MRRMLRSTTSNERVIALWSGQSRFPPTGASSQPTGPAASLTTPYEKPSHCLPHKTDRKMLPDIVIDTNVLGHPDTPTEPRYAASRALVLRLLEISTHLCVDEGFALDEARNRSFICAEYQSEALVHTQVCRDFQ